MAHCDYCGSTILFGGKREAGRVFCNDNCLDNGQTLLLADQVPQHIVDRAIEEFHQSTCPKCGGPGPIDVHVSHTVFSIIAMTSWRSSPQMCCRSCGRKGQAIGMVSSLFLGWWGFPWGVIMTPVQIVRNIAGMLGGPNPEVPSEQLETIARIDLAERIETGEPIPGVRGGGAMIPVECRFCDHSFIAEPSQAGRLIDCPVCAEEIKVPGTKGGAAEVIDEWEEVDAPSASRNEYGDSRDSFADPQDEYGGSFDDDSWEDDVPPRRSRAQRPRRNGAGNGTRRRPRKSSNGVLIAVLIGLGVLVGLPILIGVVIAVADNANDDNENVADVDRAQPRVPQFQPPQIPQPRVPEPRIRPFPGQPQGQARLLPDSGEGEKNAVPGGPPTLPGNLFPGVNPGNPNPAAPQEFKPEPVPELQNADQNAPLWIVVSNLREVPSGGVNRFNKVYAVDYQVAQGTPDPNRKYLVRLSRQISPFSERSVSTSIELKASGTIQVRTNPSFGVLPNPVTCSVVRMDGGRNVTEVSGTLTEGQQRSEALPPPGVVEAAGVAAKGKPVVIGYAQLGRFGGITPLEFKVVRQAEAVNRFAVVVLRFPSGEIMSKDVTAELQRAEVGKEVKVRAQLVGAIRDRKGPVQVCIEQHRTPIAFPNRSSPQAVLSNTLNLNPE